MAKKRTRLEVTRDLLEVLKRNRKVKITHLVYKSNLSNNSIKPYLKNLIENNMIELSHDGDGRKLFRITSRGIEFLQEFDKIKILSESYGL